MSHIFNVYCDESCHLENDGQKVMALGAVWCPADKAVKNFRNIRAIKKEYGLSPEFEIKWTKVSPAKIDFYHRLVDYFFDNGDLHFRVLIVPDKSKLRHKDFEQTHDEWYYKMYFDMLKVIFSPDCGYRIYIDMKDTQGNEKIRKLHEVLCCNFYDFPREIVQRVQIVRSHEVELLQLADLLIGAVSYANRRLCQSEAKTSLAKRVQVRSGYELVRTTLVSEKKFNIFIWHGWRKRI